MEHANLVKACIKKLYDVSAMVISVTCDGPSCHFSMLSILGASLDPNCLRTSFPQLLDLSQSIYVFLDIWHMLKLVQKTLGEGWALVNKDGNKLYWKYIVELQKLQEKEGLHLGNRLKSC